MKRATLFFLFSLVFATASVAQSLPLLIPYVSGHKWGYADTNGNVVIKPRWRMAGFFKNGRAHVYTENSHCLIDTQGAYIIPPYRHWNGKFYTSVIGAYYNATGKSGKYGIIDSNNHEILPCLYDQTNPGNGFTSSGHFIWSETLKKYIAKVSKNGKLGIIDTFNHIIIPFEYDGIDIDGYPFSSKRYFVVQKNGKDGVIDINNRTIIPAKYRNIWLDEKNDNQIKLFKDKTSVIADTNGNIVWDIPGYELEFPRHSLIPVRDSSGKYGLMDYDRKLIIPCNYLSVGIANDTIVVSKWCLDSAQRQEQCFKCYDVATLREISGWLTYRQYTKLPVPVEQPKPVLNKNLPYVTQMHIRGKDVYDYKIGNILWSAVDLPKLPEFFMPVRGIAAQDSTARYSAVIDTNGKYIIPPQLTNDILRVVNAQDSLITIQHSGDRAPQSMLDFGMQTIQPVQQYSVADFHLNTILPMQQYAIGDAFYYKGNFYAIARHDKSYMVRWQSFEGSGTSEVHDYTYFLVSADGKPVKALQHYKLHWYTNEEGRRMRHTKHFGTDNKDGFDAPFAGCFMAEDSLGRRGIVTLNGQVLLPSVSFKYYQFTPAGSNVFLVNNELPKRTENYSWLTNHTDKNSYIIDNGKLLRGLPYLVNRQNNVLLDSLSIEAITNISGPCEAPLYNVYLKRTNPYSSESDVEFYMNDKGLGYYSDLPRE